MNDNDSPPSPDFLMQLADEEPVACSLRGYGPVIRKLREEKRFSFKRITDWLIDHGVDTNQTAVYRAYAKAKGLTEAEADEDGKREDAYGDED